MADGIQLFWSANTLPWALLFIILFAHPIERWWRTAFGWSLMLLAWAVLLWTLSIVLEGTFGEFPGHGVLDAASSFLTWLAIVLRTIVLIQRQYLAGRFRFWHRWYPRIRRRVLNVHH